MSGLVTGPWRIADLNAGRVGMPRNGLRVFSCFHCGGGSSLGYKLAGYTVLGGVEIDPGMMSLYRANHRPDPRFSFQMPIQEFNKLPDSAIPPELLGLDVLDGSPPCSSFSMAGSREDAWGKSKKFREGQANQVLDDLFFHFIATADRLRPRAVIAENVKGLVLGNARGYVKEIFQAFRSAGYEAQLFLVNGASMGVPQARERTFFIARRTDLGLPRIDLRFFEAPIPVSRALLGASPAGAKPLSEKAAFWWGRTPLGGLFSVCGASTGRMNRRLDPSKPAWTQTATPNLYHWAEPRGLSSAEAARVQSFPDDYDFMDQKAGYVCGMSVPPLMMQRVAAQVSKWLSRASASPAGASGA